jgi:hypothetical protein
MAKKLYDLAVKTGEYQDRTTGETKGKWQNVGAVMQNDDGGKFIMLERWFNPAGVPNPDNRSNLLLSMFEPRQADSAPAQQRQQRPSAAAPAPAQGGFEDDDIPF